MTKEFIIYCMILYEMTYTILSLRTYHTTLHCMISYHIIFYQYYTHYKSSRYSFSCIQEDLLCWLGEMLLFCLLRSTVFDIGGCQPSTSRSPLRRKHLPTRLNEAKLVMPRQKNWKVQQRLSCMVYLKSIKKPSKVPRLATGHDSSYGSP